MYHLKRIGDWDALQPRLEELFQRERTAENAHTLTYCSRRNAQVDLNSVIEFLEENQDLVDGNDDLQSEKAWTLSQAGLMKEAREIITTLLRKRENENDLLLDINIALQLGDWDRFSAIISYAMKRAENLRADMLIYLASIAAEADVDNNRALELSKMAVDKAGDNPQIFMHAYILATQLGRDNQMSGEWFGRAIELSSDEGPVMKIDLRTMAEEMMPAHRERAREIEQALMKGEISLQFAANNLGQSLSRILAEIPKINEELQDGRWRTIVPIRSGSRGIVEMNSEWKVCLDTTSLMTLYHVGMLEKALNGFEQIVLNPDTMVFLLNERRRALFHQPSRIKRAEEFRSLLDQGFLKIAPLISDTPEGLNNEVGKDLAELLETAKANDGRVIRPFPIYKIRSYMTQEADISDYMDYLISTKAFVNILYEQKGILDSDVIRQANKYLAAQDRGGEPEEHEIQIDCPLYLDELSITYLQNVGLLKVICKSGLDIFVHSSTRADKAALVEEGLGGARLAETLNNIRIILYKAIEDGKAKFLQRPQLSEKDEKYDFFYQTAPTVANIIEDTGDCDAFCIDDRFFNKHRYITDKKNRSIPIVCVTDILHQLQVQGIITADELHIGFHKLRQAGFAFVPIPFEELEKRLGNVIWDDDDFFIESAEMRIMRQSLMRVRSLDMISLPDESLYLEQIILGSALIIRKLWSDESIATEKVINLSNWIWRNIAPSPLDWVKNLREPENKEAALEGFAQHHSVLIKPMNVGKERYDAYLKWLEDDIFSTLLPGNSDLIDALAAFARKDIKLMVEEIINDRTINDG